MSDILPITGLKVGSVSDAVVVCGDPARATRIAEQLESARLLNEKREYRIYQGQLGARTITVCSHGVGAPGAAIAFEELIVAGGKWLVRVGTCGGIQPEIGSGDLVLATGAVQNTGYGREVAPVGYPAIADMDLTLALRQTAVQPLKTGLVVTRDAFYGGIDTHQTPSYVQLAQANVLAVEMECAALFFVGSLRRVRTAAILAVDGNVLHTKESMDSYKPDRAVVQEAVQHAIQTTLTTLEQFGNDE